jgi:trehalose 6-phosphate synthase/phosphatase
MQRVLVVSNRLPVTVVAEHGDVLVRPSTGGLATALRGPHERSRGLWIGWPGDVSRLSNGQRRALDAQLAEQRTIPVHLSPSEVARYYDGFSNGVLWPLLHYLLDRVRRDAERDWPVYEDVNRRFAETVAAYLEPGDVVWVRDYQLALVPAMLREIASDVRVGFFLHVPFSSPDVFRILPSDAEIMRGIMGADVVGFHTAGYRQNFCQTALQVLGATPTSDGALRWDGRDVSIQVHPIGVDVPELDRVASSPAVEERVAAIRDGARGRKILLGVDRLDYTKGIPRRLMAFERLLDRRPSLRDDVLFVQIAVPTREKVDAYADLRRTVNELAGRVSAKHGSPTGTPLSLLYRSVALEELVALYRAADALVVTPIRDGMNLVAKEYVACRYDNDGALVLSEFAGAADELRQAYLVNPYDINGMKALMLEAYAADPKDLSRRMRAMRKVVAENDVAHWASAFLADLAAVHQHTKSVRPAKRA